MNKNFFFKLFGGHLSFPLLFGLLVTSPLGFTARVGKLICNWRRCMWRTFPEIHLWCDTCRPLYGWHEIFIKMSCIFSACPTNCRRCTAANTCAECRSGYTWDSDNNICISEYHCLFFFVNFWRTSVIFVGLLIPLFWTSGDIWPGFQSQGGCLICMFPRLHPMDSSDSPLVQHLLTSWRPALQLNLLLFLFLKIFGGHKSFLCDHWYPWFGLLVTTPLGFKARVGSLIQTWWRCACQTFP